MQNSGILFVLFIVTLICFPISIILSGYIGDLSSDSLFILKVLHPLCWFFIIITTITIIFLLESSKSFTKINLYLLLAFLVPLYVDLVYHCTVALPLSRELYHAAGILYVVKYGSARLPESLQPETVAPRVLGAIFCTITSIDPLFVISYMPSFLYPFLFSLSTYVVAEKLQISKRLSMLAAIYGVSLYFSILGMDRSTYCMPLYVITAVPILKMMKRHRSRSDAIVFLMFLFSLALSDLQFIILVPTLTLIPLICYIAKLMKIGSAEGLEASNLLISSTILTFIGFVAWNLYANPTTAHAFEIPRILFDRFMRSLSGELIQPSFAYGYNTQFLPFIRTTGYLTAIGLILPVILLLYFLFRKFLRVDFSASILDVSHLAVILAYFIPTSLLAIVGYKRTALVWISLLTIYVLHVLSNRLKVSLLNRALYTCTLSFMILVLILSPAITWVSCGNYISVKESSTLRFMGQTLPKGTVVLTVHGRGDLQAGLRYIFSDREDIVAANFFYRPNEVLSKLNVIQEDAEKFSVTMVGSIMHSGAIYDIDARTYVSKLIDMSDRESLNLIYNSGKPYYVFSKS